MRWMLIALLVECGGSAGPVLEVMDSAAPYAKASDFDGRFERVLAMSAAHWNYAGGFTGLLVVFQGGPVPCSGTMHLGCYLSSTITVATDGSNCVERSPLAHEILHYVLEREIGDPDSAHFDSRWTDLDEVLYPQLAAGTKLLCDSP